jgi:3-oxoacyl-[acyl-carrier-protein] synthase-3
MGRGLHIMDRAIGVTGWGFYVPGTVLTNKQLEQMVDTTDEWITSKTGICQRRIAHDSEATSDLAVNACQSALATAGRGPSDIDLIIVATSTPDTIQPSTASIVQGKLGALNAAAFDVSAVCAGFVYAVTVAIGMMKAFPEYRRALVIGAETYSRILDWTDRTTCVFFGDGAGAIVLEDVPQGYGYLSSYLMTDGSQSDVIHLPAGGSRLPASYETIDGRLHKFRMQGKKVWDFATRAFPEAVRQVLERAGLALSDIDLLISHQANINIIRNSMDALGLCMGKTYTNIDRYGNTSGASVPIALAEACQDGRLVDKDILVLVGFGGGLCWGSVAFRWYQNMGVSEVADRESSCRG